MAEEVVYADLRVPGGTAGTPTRGRCPRGCPLSPSLALAGGLILGVTIGVLGVLASGRPTGTPIPTAPACNGSAAELAAALRRDLCEEEEEDDGGRGRPKAPCGLCPPGWTPRAAACYRISAAARTWDDAARDCAARAARLLSPRDFPAAASLEGVMGEPNPLWVGLRFRAHAWIWPDGSQQPPPTGQRGGQGRDCGVLRRGRSALESCGAELRWLCRRDALLL
ncbi:C-type lectin domain family 12 member B-like [Morphnus guianensis]